MRCFNGFILTAILFATTVSYAQKAIYGQEQIEEIMRSGQKNFERLQNENELDISNKYNDPKTKQPRKPDAIDLLFEGNRLAKIKDQSRNSGKTEQDPIGTVYYFLSFSMPKTILADAIKTLGKNEVAVFRGPVVGEDMKDFARRLHELLGPISKEKDKQPSIALQVDPTRFKKCGITAVPATCVTTQNGFLVAHGIMSGDYLLRRAQSPDRHLGRTWDIIEIDLAEELRKRILGIKKEDFMRETVKSVFIDREYLKLPKTRVAAAFTFDPTVIRTNDMIVGDKIIAKAGQRYNPLGERGLSKSYVIFDASDAAQINLAHTLVQTLQSQNKRVKVMITDFPSHKDGFEIIPKLTKQFGTQVSIIDKQIALALRLRSVPSVVEGTFDKRIIVNEVAL